MARRAAVIGAAGGIGAACVAALAGEGWSVEAADLSAGPVPGAAASHVLDVTDARAVEAFAEAAGPVEAMIYAAGANATMPIAETDFSVWRRVMAVNLDGAAHAASAFSRAMIAHGMRGAMVFVSSAAGLRGEAGASAYCASKFGLNGLVQAVAAELVAHGIRVNAVAPGNVDTLMLREVARAIAETGGGTEAEVWESFARTGAADRILAPSEVASVCAALCGPGFSGVTGTVLPVDAGYLLA